jgi:putative DNA primase/helicase
VPLIPEPPFRRGGELIVGRLLEHGIAGYEFRDDQKLSYYLKILTNRGERVIWGKGLEKALSHAQTNPKTGDVIGARRVARQRVQLPTEDPNPAPLKTGKEPKPKYRTFWEVEKASFFADRARRARLVRDGHTDARQAVRANPELKSTFLSLRSAEELAAKRIANPEDRERFLALVREAISGSIRRGEPLPEVRLKERPKAPDDKPKPRPPDRDEPTR